MDDRFLEAYEAAAQGDPRRARRMLRELRDQGTDPERVDDLEAFLDAAGEETADVPASGAPGDVTHPGRSLGADVQQDAVPLRCLACGHDRHRVRAVVLDRRLTAFFRFDLVDRSAVTYACARCGHIAWFGRGAPGFIQAWAQDDGRLAAQGEGDATCRMCGFATMRTSRGLRNTRLLGLLGLAWLRGGARVERCARCGLLHWSATGEDEASPWTDRKGTPGTSPADPSVCPACGGGPVEAHPALQETKVAAALGLDWLDHAAWVLRCAACRAMTWWSRRPQATE